MPPFDRPRIRVVDHGTAPLPPANRCAIVHEIAPGFSHGIKVFFVSGGIRQAVGRVDKIGHPQDETHIAGVQRIDHFAGIGVSLFVEAKIVVATGPGAIDQDGSQGQVVVAASIDEVPDRIGCVNVVFPKPGPH